MNRKILVLVYHDENADWHWYGIHEALYVDDDNVPYWVGSKAIKKYDTYHNAVDAWSLLESKSGEVDILNFSEIEEITDRVDYGDDEELNFEE